MRPQEQTSYGVYGQVSFKCNISALIPALLTRPTQTVCHTFSLLVAVCIQQQAESAKSNNPKKCGAIGDKETKLHAQTQKTSSSPNCQIPL